MTTDMSRWQSWLRPAFYLGHNVVTLVGAVLTTTAAITLIGFWLRESVRDTPTHPYLGILFFMILPGVFVAGLLLMPLGVWWKRRQLRRRGELPTEWPSVDLGTPVVRNAIGLVAGATLVNVAILGTASYRGVEYMDSTEFCGLTCHSVMAPQHTAFVNGSHARVGCVQCHIGEGASWFVRSKLSGTRQVFAVNLDTFSRPIPSPVKHLRPAKETCEQCHWPQKFHGDKFIVRKKFADDETNTASTTVLVMKIGGGHSDTTGIHGLHLDPKRPISYTAIDGKRQVIPVVEAVDAAGKTQRYVSADVPATPEQLAAGERRTMDCMDCHNRPSHTFELPERALDKALAEGRVSAALPFIKKKGVEVLRAGYPDQEAGTRVIADTITAFYRDEKPNAYRDQRAQVDAAIAELQAIYRRNVFPNMKVDWGTYPNNIGHEDFVGCFRCHDETHNREDGVAISQSCDTCHTILAQDETDPKVLSDLGLK